MEQSILSWKMYEYDHLPKNSDWYWALGIIAAALAVVSLFFSNIIAAVLIIIAAITVGLHAVRPPRLLEYHITVRGVVIDRKMHPIHFIESFWVAEYANRPHKVLVKSSKKLMPYIVMPVSPDIHPDEIRNSFYDMGIPEVEHHEPLAHQLIEYLGF